MKHALRNLSGFIDFECAARWNSFKLAAKELHKTPAAVSQQIKLLEQQLGFALFVRLPRRVALTDKGEALAATVSRCLGELGETVESLRTGGGENIVRITVPHSLSLKWLVPRLSDFSRQHPAIDLRIDSSDEYVDVEAGACDLALRITRHTSDALVLGRETFVAVYSPVLQRRGRALDMGSLNRLPLLYQASPQDWLKWLQLNKALTGKHNFHRSFSHSGILVQAAVAGQGIALTPYLIAHEDLQQGRLVQLAATPLPTDCYYCALSAPGRPNATSIGVFRDWLQAQFEQSLGANCLQPPLT